MLSRVDEFVRYHETLLGEAVDDCVLSDIATDGDRSYTELWFFSAHYEFVADNFNTGATDIVVTPRHAIDLIRFTAHDYDFRKASEASQLSIYISYVDANSGELRMSGANCDHVMEIYAKYWKPALVRAANVVGVA